MTGVEEFKARTEEKVRGVVCPKHRRAPRVEFQGSTLRDITVRLSGCCERLIEMANQKIAERG